MSLKTDITKDEPLEGRLTSKYRVNEKNILVSQNGRFHLYFQRAVLKLVDVYSKKKYGAWDKEEIVKGLKHGRKRVLWEKALHPKIQVYDQIDDSEIQLHITDNGDVRLAYLYKLKGKEEIAESFFGIQGAKKLQLTNDGDFEILNRDRDLIWSSNTKAAAVNIPFWYYTNPNGNGHLYDGRLTPNNREIEVYDKNKKLAGIGGIKSIKLTEYNYLNLYQWRITIIDEKDAKSKHLTFYDKEGDEYRKACSGNGKTYTLDYKSNKPDIVKVSFIYR